MEKARFLSLVQNYTALTSEEATALAALQVDFPYSQVVHNLAARAAQDNNLGSKDHLLHVSAIYTTDRTVLKAIMTASRGGRTAEPEVEITPARPVLTKVVQPEEVTVGKTGAALEAMDLEGDALRADVIAELEKLKVNRHNFEVNMEAYEKGHPFESKPAKKAKKPLDPSDTLIEEIKTTKKKVAPEGKQKEQIEIIENFIKTKPSIAKNKAAAIPASDDLAEKSLLYGDNIVSETLVEILLKQGKKDKAIEVLKKLIWKFPQKKAYFAARIEELKN